MKHFLKEKNVDKKTTSLFKGTVTCADEVLYIDLQILCDIHRVSQNPIVVVRDTKKATDKLEKFGGNMPLFLDVDFQHTWLGITTDTHDDEFFDRWFFVESSQGRGRQWFGVVLL
jgi:hypothetical protein